MLKFLGKLFQKKTVENSQNDFIGMAPNFGGTLWGAPSNNILTELKYTRTALISRMWHLLSYQYATIGIVQTIIDTPVTDGFANGYEIVTEDLTVKEVSLLKKWMNDHSVDSVVIDTMKWMRLFGGGGIIIDVVGEDPKYELSLEDLGPDDEIKLLSASMWELFNYPNSHDEMNEMDQTYGMMSAAYKYRNLELHPSRVIRINGKEPPDFIKRYLRGWGLSELEGLISALNRYVKGIEASFEILDECKIDVFKIHGFNAAAIGINDPKKLQQQFDMINMFKNNKRAIVIDSEDDFLQKNLRMDWIPQTMAEIRRQLASDTSMPENRLFGIGSEGFSDGSDVMSNYTIMIKSRIHNVAKPIYEKVMAVACANLFGRVPKRIGIEFNPFLLLNEREREEVETKRVERILMIFERGLMDAKTAKEAINRERVIPVNLPENDEIFHDFAEQEMGEVGNPPSEADEKADAKNVNLGKRISDGTSGKPVKGTKIFTQSRKRMSRPGK
jgi:phage-related protein (TIGR01555 family)